MNQDAIEKNYYESIMVGHYIDVRYAENDWKIAKIIERDKRYALVSFDATNTKEEQILLQSFKVAPLRMNTEGYTGSNYRAYRTNLTPIQQYKTHLQILNTYVKQVLPNPYTITQYLRGELFVLVHSLLCQEDFKEEQGAEAMKFLLGFIEFVAKLAERVKKIAPEYFQALTNNKYQYLINEKVALVNSLSEMLSLLNIILRVQNSKVVNFFKSKFISIDLLVKFFLELGKIQVFADLFNLNDGNAKWLSFGIHKRLYFLLKKFNPRFTLPNYKLKDYQEVLQIYSFVIKVEQKQNNIELFLVEFIIDLLKEQSTFEAKLKGLQQLKKIIQDQTKLYTIDKKAIFNLLHQHGVLDHMTSEYNFNPEIFKRFIPILSQYCKHKEISIKNIAQLFKISNNRHESEVVMIQQIICCLCEFIKVDSLDSIYAQIAKANRNNEQTMKFIKNFTISAISNLARQKSFFTSFFRKAKISSSKHGHYGLDLFMKQIQDGGCFDKGNTIVGIDMIKQMFSKKELEGERFNYIMICLEWIDKLKNYFQSVKVIDSIISNYPASAYIDESRKQIIQRLVVKHNFIEKLIFGLKKTKISQVKFSFKEILKCVYEFLESYYDSIISHININHIQFLWSLQQKKMLSQFLKKSKDTKKKHVKKLDENIQDDILNKLVRKPSFYSRELFIEQFDALNEIFISYNFLKKKIQVSERLFVRYLTPEMEGYSFYFQFIEKMSKNANINRIIKKTIQIFLRPKDQKNIQTKINTWKLCLLKIVDKLKQYPQVCLKAIQFFFEMIQGSQTRQNISVPPGNIEVIVSSDSQQKTIVLPKKSTIWRLRKQIMADFGIKGDFTMFCNNMRRDVHFGEEEEFSLNALPLENKGPSITVVNRKKQKHIHIQAYQKFKQLIEKEEMFYQILFALNNQSIQELFWKTVDLLPVNRSLVRKIQNCQNFTKKNWQSILKISTKQSLQYHLNIIFDLMERNKKWVALFYGTEGVFVILDCLVDGKGNDERITNRCLLILIKVMEVVDKIQQNTLQQANITLLAKVLYVFKQQIPNISASLQTINLIFNIFNKISKSIKVEPIQLKIVLKILTYGIFKPKNKHTIQFIENDFEHYLINNYSSSQEKKIIFEYILKLLDVQTLLLKDNSQMLFIFFIDYMNTFIEEEQKFIQQEGHLQQIQQFVVQCLKNNMVRDLDKTKFHPLLFGSLKLLIYTMNNKDNKYDLKELFSIFFSQFLFNKQQKRLKSQVTTKLVYQSLKKILFLHPNLIEVLTSQIVPQLIKSPWRKNMLSAWSIESKRQQRVNYCGLENLGATCYINCLFQQLFHIQHFRQHFLSIKSQEYKPSLDQNQIYQLQYIFSCLKYTSKRSISIKKFCDSFITYEGAPINPMVQSDADQFYNALMEKIQSFLKINQRHDIIQNTFQGKLSNQINCIGCPHKSEKLQNFMSIGVNIRGKKCLQQALQGYVQGQILDGDNAYFCEICQKKVKTLKRMCIKKLPNILVIVLKRFQFNYDQMRKIKINTYLKFPEILNMQRYTADYLGGDVSGLQGQFTYALRGTVIHSGTSQGGHYYSFAKPADKWYSFNDEYIEEINSKKVEEDGFGGEDKGSETQFKFQKHKNAYILFYQKTQTTNEYHRNESEILNSYSESIKKDILVENNNAQFLSVILDDHFIRLAQNISCLENEQSFKFTMLYFHTVVLRDKNKDQHIPNYYRIISNQLQNQQKSQWYLRQINHRFIKEFLIEGPRTVRFITTSLIIQAIKVVQNVPDNIFTHGIFCLRKSGMTPFAKIFKQLSKNQAYLKRLNQMEYSKRVIAIVLDQSNNNFPINQVQSFQSYFGSDSSQKQKEKEICYSSLCQSLQNFEVSIDEAMQLLSKQFSRSGSKVVAGILGKRVTEEQIITILSSLQGQIQKEGEFRRQEIEKYMFFIRAACLSADQASTWKIVKSAQSLKRILYQCRTYYDPLDTILRQINYIACRNQHFRTILKEVLHEKENGFDVIKSLKYWLKDCDRPSMYSKSQDFKRRVNMLNFEQKSRYEYANKLQLDRRMNWILQKDSQQQIEISSDIEDSQNKQLIIRNKKFKIKQHLGLIKRVEIDGHQKWGILQKQELDLYMSI